MVKGDLPTKVAGSKVSALPAFLPMSLGLPMWIKTLLHWPLGGQVSIGSGLCGDGPYQGPGECFPGGSLVLFGGCFCSDLVYKIF